MRKSLIALLLLFSLIANSQSNNYFEKVDFDSSIVVIGTGPYSQSGVDKFERFEFIIRGEEEFNQLKKQWNFNKPVAPVIQKNLFFISVIKDKQVIKGGAISPSNSNIRFKEGWYYFDTSLLQNLGRTNHLKYYVEEKQFVDSVIFEKYYDSVKTLRSLLYLIKPSYAYEGSFNITLLKRAELQDARQAISFLKSEFEKISPGSNTQIVMFLDEFNRVNNKTAIRLNVSAKKELFEALKRTVYEVDQWKPASFRSTIFWQQ